MIKLDEIKARCEAATPGPWTPEIRGNTIQSHCVVCDTIYIEKTKNICSGISPKTKNAEFITHARTDIPALLSLLSERDKEITRLTAENSHWEEINDTQAEQLGVAYDRTAELLAENKTLRGELCLHCGKYKEAHLGRCKGCRWRDSVDVNKMEG
jgi:hypothetical protein